MAFEIRVEVRQVESQCDAYGDVAIVCRWSQIKKTPEEIEVGVLRLTFREQNNQRATDRVSLRDTGAEDQNKLPQLNETPPFWVCRESCEIETNWVSFAGSDDVGDQSEKLAERQLQAENGTFQ